MWSGGDGGFVDGGQAAGGFSSFASPSQAKKEQRVQNLVPLTIKTILDTPGDSPIIIGGCEVKLIGIVALIRTVEISSTKITYGIDDSTGIIDAVEWIEASENDADKEPQRPLMEMTYCKLVGSLRTQMGKKHVIVFNLKPVTDLNRLTTHLLEAMHTSMKLKQIAQMGDAAGDTSNQQAMGGSSMLDGNMTSMAGGQTQGLVGMQKEVFNLVKFHRSEQGIDRKELHQTLTNKSSPMLINKVIDDLLNEGLLFCSIDDEHFKTADF